MAAFCTKCGAPLSSGAGFCPACGSAVESNAVPPPVVPEPVAPPAAAASYPAAPAAGYAPVPPPVYAAAPPAGYAAVPTAGYGAPPPKKSGALKIVLIVIAVVVVLGIATVGILGYIGYRAMHSAGNALAVGSSADVSEADLGVSIYPGATRNASGSMRLKVAGNLVVSATYTTTDPVANVLTYYQGKLGPNATAIQSGPATTLTSSTVNGTGKESIVITVTPSAQANGTQFTVVHTESSAAAAAPATTTQ